MAILFIGHTRIGDAVLSTGLLNHLATDPASAGSPITVACGPVPAPLFKAAPGVAEVIAIRKRSHSRHWYDLWRQVVGRRWDLIVDLRNSIIPWTVRTSRRAIMPRGQPGEHRILQIGGTLNLRADPPMPRLWATEAQHATARALLNGEDAAPILAIGPTANWAGKIWSAENFVTLISELTGPSGILPGARVAVFGAPTERSIAAPVLAQIPSHRRIDLVGAVDLPTAYACLTKANLFIGHDSGLMHMAAAADIPTLGLFGPSRQELYAPWGDKAAYVRTKKSVEELFGAPGFDHRTTGSLMDSLDRDEVIEAAVALWQSCRDN